MVPNATSTSKDLIISCEGRGFSIGRNDRRIRWHPLRDIEFVTSNWYAKCFGIYASYQSIGKNCTHRGYRIVQDGRANSFLYPSNTRKVIEMRLPWSFLEAGTSCVQYRLVWYGIKIADPFCMMKSR